MPIYQKRFQSHDIQFTFFRPLDLCQNYRPLSIARFILIIIESILNEENSNFFFLYLQNKNHILRIKYSCYCCYIDYMVTDGAVSYHRKISYQYGRRTFASAAPGRRCRDPANPYTDNRDPYQIIGHTRLFAVSFFYLSTIYPRSIMCTADLGTVCGNDHDDNQLFRDKYDGELGFYFIIVY